MTSFRARSTMSTLAAASVLALSVGGAAWAHAGGGGSGNSGQGGQNANGECPAGTSRTARDCAQRRSERQSDDALYARGRALALAGDYAAALAVLDSVHRGDDPMVFTMRGYATRKLGRIDEAMVLYARALTLDPDNVNTHEYIGEAYVTIGRIDLARLEMVKVQRACGNTECEQYEDLTRAIAAARP